MPTLTVDPVRSRFGFRAKGMVVMPVPGSLQPRSGTVTIADGRLSAEGVADAASVTARPRLAPRDAHLRHKHYLWADEHPDVTLRVEDMPVDARSVTGQLTARGKTVDVPLEITAFEQAPDGTLTLKATGVFDRTPLGMLPPIAGASRRIELDIELVAS